MRYRSKISASCSISARVGAVSARTSTEPLDAGGWLVSSITVFSDTSARLKGDPSAVGSHLPPAGRFGRPCLERLAPRYGATWRPRPTYADPGDNAAPCV